MKLLLLNESFSISYIIMEQRYMKESIYFIVKLNSSVFKFTMAQLTVASIHVIMQLHLN
jgi:hypothetical protein